MMTHKAKCFVIDACNTRDRLRNARPMHCVGVGEVIGCRPDAEVRVVRDERCRRRSRLRPCDANSETNNGKMSKNSRDHFHRILLRQETLCYLSRSLWTSA